MSIQDYHHRHAGERCFILGSGPSIADLDLARLKAEVSFASNWFINHAELQRLALNYYCAHDAAFVRPQPNAQWLARLADLSAQKFFPQTWSAEARLPAAEFVRYEPAVKVYRERRFSADPQAGLYDGGSVVINLSLPLAMYMGFREIILLGVETDYRIADQGDLRQAYFYPPSQQHTRNAHTPDTEGRWIETTLQAYAVVQDYAQRHGIRIINATPGGRLEVFRRCPLEQILQGKAT